MPILDVEIVLHPQELLPAGIAGAIANKAGAIFKTPPAQTWVKVHAIPFDRYAENHKEASDAVYPVFVHILKAKIPSPEALQAEVEALGLAIAEICQRPPANIHLFYLPAGAGRVAFGGEIVPD